MSFYTQTLQSIKNTPVSLSAYKGKVVLIVNVASECGYTNQYTGLEELYKKYNSKGLEVLGVPCNQFGGQEPGTNEQIANFCTSKHSITFPMFAKVDVNGAACSPLFTFLKSQQPGEIGWNFEKFLVDKEGKVVKRFKSGDKPANIASDIEKYL